MRLLFLLVMISACVGAPALAQVTVNLDALNALPGTKAHSPRAPHVARSHRPGGASVARALPVPPIPPETPPSAVASGAPAAGEAKGAQSAAAAPANVPAAKSAAPPSATVPPQPPAEVALAPLSPATPPAVPPAPPPVVPGVDSHAATNAAGVSVTFAPDGSDLSPASAATITELARSVPQSDSVSFNVLAYAKGQAQDPSSTRRLSLARALAVRNVLLAAGIPSARIYVRAMGAATGPGPADRADITVMGTNAPVAVAATPHPSPGGKQE